MGCDQNKIQEVTQIKDDIVRLLETTVDDAQQKLPSKNQITSMSQEELEKLFAFEYKVVEVKDSSDALKLETQLNALGRERYDCTVASLPNERIRLTCKRPSRALLRFALSRLFGV